MITKACTRCGACISECPTQSIIEGRDIYYIDSDTCSEHRACAIVCPVDAIVHRPETRPKKIIDDNEEEM